MFELYELFIAACGYLGILFFVAYAAEKRWLPNNLTKHPIVYTLSLGVYATSWSYYGSVGLAQQQGFAFLPIYLGVTLAFALTPVLLIPILKVTRDHQLTSLADLFAFRFRSQLAGVLVTLFMLVGTLPYIALQIRAVTDSISILTQQASPKLLSLGFCIVLIVFSVLFGARHTSTREKHRGLVVAVAFESAIKLIALLVIGLAALYGTWGGYSEFSNWLNREPQILESLYANTKESAWVTLVLLAFCAAFLLPRQFHMIFTENIEPRTLHSAAWMFPLFLLLLNLPIPIILLAGQFQNLDMPADYYVLGIALQFSGNSILPIFAFIGGISAASAMVIVTTIALSSMCTNHLLLPANFPAPEANLYRKVLWGKRIIISIIISAGYGFYYILEHNEGLVQLGLVSFVAVAQFLPGIIGVLFWKSATRLGFIFGLLGGITIWSVVLLLPLVDSPQLLNLPDYFLSYSVPAGENKWAYATFYSLTINSILFVVVSLLTRPTREEITAYGYAKLEPTSLLSGVVVADTVEKFKENLTRSIGAVTADREVDQALVDLHLEEQEIRPTQLRRLRDQIEKNLSGLIGPQLAHIITSEELELHPGASSALGDSVRYIESKLHDSTDQLKGLTAELNLLHKYHRQILEDLPLPVCSIGPDDEILIWNQAMERLTDVDSESILNKQVSGTHEPWRSLLSNFISINNDSGHIEIEINNKKRWFDLHKAEITLTNKEVINDSENAFGTVVLINDLTEIEMLQSELLHSERLATVGRFAAGFAHEVGNPITGIASIAQNLREESDSQHFKNDVTLMLEQVDRIKKILNSLMSYSHGSDQEFTIDEFEVVSVIDDSIKLINLTHKNKNIEITPSVEESIQLIGDRNRITQVFVNLLSNAIDASKTTSTIDIVCKKVNNGAKVGAEIKIIDYGSGISETNKENLFEPFFTTKKSGEGTGLGLHVVYRIIKDHHGNIAVDSQENHGTTVTVWLPKYSRRELGEKLV